MAEQNVRERHSVVKQVVIRVSEDERVAYGACAAMSGTSVTGWMRRVLADEAMRAYAGVGQALPLGLRAGEGAAGQQAACRSAVAVGAKLSYRWHGGVGKGPTPDLDF